MTEKPIKKLISTGILPGTTPLIVLNSYNKEEEKKKDLKREEFKEKIKILKEINNKYGRVIKNK